MSYTVSMLYVIDDAIRAVNDCEEIPEILRDPITDEDAFKLIYHRTDAWRGYYDAEAIEGSGWVKHDGSWVTGDWDDAPMENRSSTVEAKINALAENQDVVLIVAPTSNVFSTGYDVFVREADGG